MDERDDALLALVRAEPGLSAARACKRLAWSRSELLRTLTQLGARVRVESDGERDTLWPGGE